MERSGRGVLGSGLSDARAEVGELEREAGYEFWSPNTQQRKLKLKAVLVQVEGDARIV